MKKEPRNALLFVLMWLFSCERATELLLPYVRRAQQQTDMKCSCRALFFRLSRAVALVLA